MKQIKEIRIEWIKNGRKGNGEVLEDQDIFRQTPMDVTICLARLFYDTSQVGKPHQLMRLLSLLECRRLDLSTADHEVNVHNRDLAAVQALQSH